MRGSARQVFALAALSTGLVVLLPTTEQPRGLQRFFSSQQAVLDVVFPSKFSRQLDQRVAAACNASESAQRLDRRGLRLAQYNVFRMQERGAADLIGAWLQARDYDYVCLNELNGFNESQFEAWARGHNFKTAFLLLTASGYHVGFAARDESCAVVERRTDGFFHGVLHVRCGASHFLATHLTPYEASTRLLETRALADMVGDALRESGSRVALFGDLNSPPYARPYVELLPGAITSLADDMKRFKIKHKFLDEDEQLVDALGRDFPLVDPCIQDARDSCAPTVPTFLRIDGMHAMPLRLDFVLLGGAWGLGEAATVSNVLTDILSDHFPLEVVATLADQPLLRTVEPVIERKVIPVENADATLRASVAWNRANATTEEFKVACRWTEELAAEEKSAHDRRQAVILARADDWRREQSELFGIPGARWKTVGANRASTCQQTCENTSSLCIDKSRDFAYARDCDRMTATFGCPFGCHDAVGDELPAFVSDVDNFHAGRCLLPAEHSRNTTRRKRKRHARRLLGRGAKNEYKEKKKQRRPLVRALASLGLDLSFKSRSNDLWCSAAHKATSRLCSCLDVTVVRAEPSVSCDAACRRTGAWCHNDVLRTFNPRACPLYHARQGDQKQSPRSANKVAGNGMKSFDDVRSAILKILPAVLTMPANDACLFAAPNAQRQLSCMARLDDASLVGNCNKNNPDVPQLKRISRLCPCVLRRSD